MSLRDKMLAVISEVNGELAERQELVESIAIALLTRSNLFILGKPGQAKSHSINLFRQRITGMRQFERQMSKQADEEQLFGRIDLSSLIPGSVPEAALKGDPVYQNLREDLNAQLCRLTGAGDADGAYELVKRSTEKLNAYRAAFAALHPSEPTVQTAGKIPEADIVFLDEIFKANDGILNSLLAALNERRYTNEGHTYDIPVISFFTASNEIPNFADPQEKSLEALYDRLQIKVITADIEDRGNRLSLLRKKQSGACGSVSATITLDELLAMQQEVKAVEVTDNINELADDILCELRRGGITVSDRKYLNFAPLAQAKAWLEGHGKVQAQDMLVLRNYLWQKPSDRTVVDAVLNRLCVNPMQAKVEELAKMALDAEEDFHAARSAAATPSTANKALIKLRAELVRLYRSQQELAAGAQSDSETAMAASLLDGLEQISKNAHEEAGFTYAPLAQLEALQ